MSYEFEMQYGMHEKPDLERLGVALRAHQDYQVLNVTSEVLQGAFGGVIVDAKWPEDFTVSVNDSMRVLSIHGGTAQQRQRLVEALRKLLEDQGVNCEFEEL